MNDKTRNRVWKWSLIGLFGVAALALAAGGYWLYRHETQAIRSEKQSELKAIAELKANQIAAWRKRAFGRRPREFKDGGILRTTVGQWLKASGDASSRTDIQEDMELFARSYGYENVILAAPDGRILLSLDPRLTVLDASAKQLVAQAISSRDAVFGDLFRCPTCNEVHLDVAAPILDPENRPVAVLILRTDAEQFLYPFVQSWPTPSRSAETLLMRRDGDDVAVSEQAPPPARPGPDPAHSAVACRRSGRPGGPRADRSVRGAGLSRRGSAGGDPARAGLALVHGGQGGRRRDPRRGPIPRPIHSSLHRPLHARDRRHGRLRVQLSAEDPLPEPVPRGAAAAASGGGNPRHLLQHRRRRDLDRRRRPRHPDEPRGRATHRLERGGGVGQAPGAGLPHRQRRDPGRGRESDRSAFMREGTVVGLANHTLLMARDGTERPIADSGAPIRNEKGQVTGVVLVFRDQTEERRAEMALRESEERYRVLFEGSAQGILVADAETRRFMYANPSICEMLGYTADELTRLGVADIHPEDSLDHVASEFESQIRGEKTLAPALPCLRKDGTVFYADVNASAIVIEGRKCNVGFFTDITERKRAEQTLRDSETRHRTLFESSSDAVMTLAPPSWKFTSCNPATVKMFGVKDEAEFTSLGPWQLSPEVQPDGRPSAEKAKEMIETAMREGSHFFEWTHKRLNGEDFPATVWLTRMELAGQALLQATVRDISEWKNARDREARSLRRLEGVNRASEGTCSSPDRRRTSSRESPRRRWNSWTSTSVVSGA